MISALHHLISAAHHVILVVLHVIAHVMLVVHDIDPVIPGEYYQLIYLIQLYQSKGILL